MDQARARRAGEKLHSNSMDLLGIHTHTFARVPVQRSHSHFAAATGWSDGLTMLVHVIRINMVWTDVSECEYFLRTTKLYTINIKTLQKSFYNSVEYGHIQGGLCVCVCASVRAHLVVRRTRASLLLIHMIFIPSNRLHARIQTLDEKAQVIFVCLARARTGRPVLAARVCVCAPVRCSKTKTKRKIERKEVDGWAMKENGERSVPR